MYHFQRFSLYALPSNLLAEPILSFLVAPAAIAAALCAPFGLSEAPLQVMASGLDLIAAIGQTFGERGEAVQAVPKPPDLAFCISVLALLWACLWRGSLRWLSAPIFAASVALYVLAPRPIFAFDSELRAVYGRDNGQWTLLTNGRSTYARDRLGSLLGLSPSEIEHLAPPEACSETLCQWRTGARTVFFPRDLSTLESACVDGAVVITRGALPIGYAQRCNLRAAIGARDLAALGGATLTETPLGAIISRAWPPGVHRPWTPRAHSADQE